LNRLLKQKVMRFNMLTTKEQVTQNHEGAQAWEMDARTELYAAVSGAVAQWLEQHFYRLSPALLLSFFRSRKPQSTLLQEKHFGVKYHGAVGWSSFDSGSGDAGSVPALHPQACK
jgi:hypothetical protein